jgi:hypothetical protein
MPQRRQIGATRKLRGSTNICYVTTNSLALDYEGLGIKQQTGKRGM